MRWGRVFLVCLVFGLVTGLDSFFRAPMYQYPPKNVEEALLAGGIYGIILFFLIVIFQYIRERMMREY